MGFWIPLAIFIGTTILGAVFRPRVKAPAAVIGPSPGDLQYPTTDDGPIIVPFGTCFIRQPTVIFEKKIAPVPIVDSGVTVGHKYYAGLQLGICHGAIAGLRSIRFNDKAVGAGISVPNNKIVFGIGAIPATAEIAPGNYANGGELSTAIEAAMHTAFPADWKVAFGFHVQAGRNDQIVYQFTELVFGSPVTTRVTATIAAGVNTSDIAFANAVRNALNNSAVGVFSWTVAFNGSHKMVLTPNWLGDPAAFAGWDLLGGPGIPGFYTRTANHLMGFKLHLTYSGGIGAVTGDYSVLLNRFVVAFAGTTGFLKLTDPNFTAAATLGFSTAADATLGQRLSDTDYLIITATYTDAGDYTQVDINDPNFFGTDGGIQGRIDVYKGFLSQAGSSYLTAAQGQATPPYPGLCHAVLHDVYVGNSNYLKPLGFEVLMLVNELGIDPLIATIGDDANPAAVIWEVAKNDRWGLGSAAPLDQASFQAVAQTLYDEGLGISMAWNQVQPAREYLDDVLRHIDGVIYKDPTSGKRKLKLARADYVVASLPQADEDNVMAVSLRRPSWDELKNVIRIRYLDRGAGYVERVEQVQDLAGIQSRGGIQDVEEIAFLGLSTATNAKKIALRTLLALGYPLASLELTVQRDLWALHVGAVFRLSWAPLGLVDVPCRVTNVEGGYLGKDEIHLQAVEDIFGVAS